MMFLKDPNESKLKSLGGHHDQGPSKTPINRIEELIVKDPSDPLLLSDYIGLSNNYGQLPRAIRFLERMTYGNAFQSKSALGTALQLFLWGEYAKILAILQSGPEREEFLAPHWLGVIHDCLGLDERAEKFYRESIDKHSYIRSIEELIGIHFRTRNPERARPIISHFFSGNTELYKSGCLFARQASIATIHAYAAWVHLESGDFEKGSLDGLRVLKQGSAYPIWVLSLAYFRAGLYSEFLKTLGVVLDLDENVIRRASAEDMKALCRFSDERPSEKDLLYALSLLLLRSGEIERAESFFLKALKDFPGYRNVYYFSGECARLRGRVSMALYRYFQALQYDPSHSEALRGIFQLPLEKDDECLIRIQLMEKWLQMKFDPAIAWELAGEFSRKGKFADEAGILLRILDNTAGPCTDVLEALSRSLANQNNHSLLYQTARSLDSVKQSALFWSSAAKAAICLGKPEDAGIFTGRSLASIDGQTAETLATCIDVCLARGDLSGAKAALEDAVNIGTPGLFCAKAAVSLADKDYDTLWMTLKELARQAPDAFEQLPGSVCVFVLDASVEHVAEDGLFPKALCHYYKKEYLTAEHLFQVCLERFPALDRARFYLAKTCVLLRKHEEALKLYKELEESQYQDLDFLRSYSRFLNSLRRFEETIGFLEKARGIVTADRELTLLLLSAYAEVGRSDKFKDFLFAQRGLGVLSSEDAADLERLERLVSPHLYFEDPLCPQAITVLCQREWPFLNAMADSARQIFGEGLHSVMTAMDGQEKCSLVVLVEQTDQEKNLALRSAFTAFGDIPFQLCLVESRELWEALNSGNYELIKLIVGSKVIYDRELARILKVLWEIRERTLAEFAQYVVSIIFFGSLSRGKGSPGSDIDIWFIIDDTDVKKMGRQELKDRLRGLIGKMAQDSASRFGVQRGIDVAVHPLTVLWEWLRAAHPMLSGIFTDGRVLHDRGFFGPIRMLYNQGDYKPCGELLEDHRGRPYVVLESLSPRLKEIALDICRSVRQIGDSLLMVRGARPPIPELACSEIKRIWGNSFDERYLDEIEDLLKTAKKIKYGHIIPDGKMVDALASQLAAVAAYTEELISGLGSPARDLDEVSGSIGPEAERR
jgi:tetratricopeptide (TPR) repeat protein/predicted nucleotidyltransferase